MRSECEVYTFSTASALGAVKWQVRLTGGAVNAVYLRKNESNVIRRPSHLFPEIFNEAMITFRLFTRDKIYTEGYRV